MGLIRKIIFSMVSEETRKAMEADSRRWVFRCKEGHEESIWDLGGIKYKAYGDSFSIRRCPGCGGKIRVVRLTKKPLGT